MNQMGRRIQGRAPVDIIVLYAARTDLDFGFVVDEHQNRLAT